MPFDPATTALTVNPLHPGTWRVSLVDAVRLGGVTSRPDQVGQVVWFPLGMLVLMTSADAVAPGAMTTLVGPGVAVRVAWAAWLPEASRPATPG